MSSAQPENTYPDKEYEDAHLMTFSAPKVAIPNILPVDVSQETFSQAVGEFTDAIGKDNVFIGAALSHYVDPYDLSETDPAKRKLPSAAVWLVPRRLCCIVGISVVYKQNANKRSPSSVEQVRAVLAIATNHSIPLWTFSRGKNLG